MDLRLTVSGRGHISQARRGVQLEMSYLSDSRVLMRYKLPLGEIVTDFYDEINSISAGYVRSGPRCASTTRVVVRAHAGPPASPPNSFDYEDAGYERTQLVKVGSIEPAGPGAALQGGH